MANLTNREKNLVFILALALVALGGYFLLWRAVIPAYLEGRAALEERRLRLEDGLSSMERLGEDLEEQQRLAARLAGEGGLLSAGAGGGPYVVMGRAAAAAGVEVLAVSPGEVSTQGQLEGQALQVRVRGPYLATVDFLANLEGKSGLVEVRSFDLAAEDPGEGQQGQAGHDPLMVSVLNLTFYHAPEIKPPRPSLPTVSPAPPGATERLVGAVLNALVGAAYFLEDLAQGAGALLARGWSSLVSLLAPLWAEVIGWLAAALESLRPYWQAAYSWLSAVWGEAVGMLGLWLNL